MSLQVIQWSSYWLRGEATKWKWCPPFLGHTSTEGHMSRLVSIGLLDDPRINSCLYHTTSIPFSQIIPTRHPVLPCCRCLKWVSIDRTALWKEVILNSLSRVLHFLQGLLLWLLKFFLITQNRWTRSRQCSRNADISKAIPQYLKRIHRWEPSTED